MPTDPAANVSTSIRLHKLVRASRERVFEAWTTPEQMCEWFAPEPDIVCKDVSIEPKVGGAFRFTMQSPNATHTGGGTITAFDRPTKLAYTWSWEGMPDFGADSLVTIELFEAQNPYDPEQPATEVVLTHAKLNSAAERSEHTGGWWGTLRALGFYVRGVDPREAMAPSEAAGKS
ncbi:MAG: SRPBCC domain-containing protein [Planctomycetota bacterium]